jgi:hypothetical protein
MVKVDSLITELDAGIVVFMYKKINGTIRKAVGTRNNEYVPCNKQASDNPMLLNETVSYFDLLKQQWRNLKSSNFVDIFTSVNKDNLEV